jgi:hypothetical protein
MKKFWQSSTCGFVLALLLMIFTSLNILTGNNFIAATNFITGLMCWYAARCRRDDERKEKENG